MVPRNGPFVRARLALLIVCCAAASAQAQRRIAPTPTTTVTARLDAFFRRASSFGQFNGAVLVAEHGRVVYEGAFGEANREWRVPNSVDTRFEIASMTKPMTAIVIMQLVEEGKVRLDAHVSDYLPNYPRESGSRITIDQLLSHTSGLQQDIAFADDASKVPPIVAVINADMLTNDSLVALIAQRPLRFAPGSSFGYSSDGYAVLGAVVEHVTGMSYWDALRKRVFDPAGMHETGVSVLRPLVSKRAYGYAQTFDGYENAPHIGVTPAGGLYSTLRDMYRFDRALRSDALVKQRSKDLLFATRTVTTAYGWKTSEQQRNDGSKRKVQRTTGGLPGFAALLLRVPSEDRVIIMLSNTRDLEWRFDDFGIAVNQMLDGEAYALPRRSIAQSLAEAIRTGGAGKAMGPRFTEMRKDSVNYVLTESEMNSLGYYLLNAKHQPAEAMSVFSLNVAAFPKSANAYDSLGESYLALRDTARAVANYRQSLALNPGNTNAADILKRLAP